MLQLSGKWIKYLASKGETGMGYQVVSITLNDGTKYDQVAIVGAQVAEIRGRKDIPFSDSDIKSIKVTHQKWDFNKE